MGVSVIAPNDVRGQLEAALANVAKWIDDAGIMPPQSLIGVARLVLPDLVVEIEATAAA